MKRVSSSFIKRDAAYQPTAAASKPSMYETVKKYGGMIGSADGEDDAPGKLEVKVIQANVVNSNTPVKTIERTEIIYNGKVIGSQG